MSAMLKPLWTHSPPSQPGRYWVNLPHWYKGQTLEEIRWVSELHAGKPQFFDKTCQPCGPLP
jgi:hypothetical protein